MELIEIKEFSRETYDFVRTLSGQLYPAGPPRFTEDDLRAMVACPCSHLFLLLDQGRRVGMLTAGICRTPGGVKSYIEDVVVDSEARGRGYGRELVARSLDFLRAQGAQYVYLSSNPAREAANALYSSMGFERRETNFYKLEF